MLRGGAKLGSPPPPPSCATDCRRKEESVCGVTITFIILCDLVITLVFILLLTANNLIRNVFNKNRGLGKK